MRSQELFERASRVIPGGVNSPVRAFQSVGGDPIYVAKAKGSRMTTVDGEELIDFCSSWGPLLFGHARDEIVEAICQAVACGTSFGTNTIREVDFAEQLCDMVPSIDKIRIVNSGTEATMTALRLARGFTGRRKIIKFDGCYHGHADYLLVSAGSGLLTGGLSSSAGVSESAAAEVLVPSFNDIHAVEELVATHGQDLAAIIVEPVAGNMGLIRPIRGFLESLRNAADDCGALLIFDEVITGFRLGPTTYGQRCGIRPDLTCLGKIIGGGLPIGAVGGRADVMDSLAPLGNVYQAGTLSGNPVALAAGLAMLSLIRKESPYVQLKSLGVRVADGLNAASGKGRQDMHCVQLGGLLTPFFRNKSVSNLADAKACDTSAYAAFFHAMLKRGIYLSPSQFELAFISAAHSQEDCDIFVAAAHEVLSS